MPIFFSFFSSCRAPTGRLLGFPSLGAAATVAADVFWQDLFRPITVIFHVQNGFVVATVLVGREWMDPCLVIYESKIFTFSVFVWRFLLCCVKCHKMVRHAFISAEISRNLFANIVRYRRIAATKNNGRNQISVYGPTWSWLVALHPARNETSSIFMCVFFIYTKRICVDNKWLHLLSVSLLLPLFIPTRCDARPRLRRIEKKKFDYYYFILFPRLGSRKCVRCRKCQSQKNGYWHTVQRTLCLA